MQRLLDRKHTPADNQSEYRRANHRLYNILTLHFFERLLFLSVGIVIPLKLVSTGNITGPETGLFYFLLFVMYRCTPLFFSYATRYIRREIIFIIGGIIEVTAMMLLVYHNERLIIFSLALLAGFGGGATTTMLISLIESANLDVTALRKKVVNHGIFNIHLMLINASAFISPLFAFLPERIYQAGMGLMVLLIVLLVINMLWLGKISHNSRQEVPVQTHRRFDSTFFLIWAATLSVWAAASIVYAILPSLDSCFLGQEGINIWLSFDALVVIALFFMLKAVRWLRENTAVNAAVGLIAILAGLLLIIVGKQELYIILAALAIMAFGGYIAFGQLYGLAMQTRFPHRKTVYLGLLSFSGAVGEGGMQGLFWLTNSVNICLIIACCLVIAGLISLSYLKKKDVA